MMSFDRDDGDKIEVVERQAKDSFARFFKMTADPEVVARLFGYSFDSNRVSWEYYDGPLNWIEPLRKRMDEILPYVSINSEQARREILIAPILLELVHSFHVVMRMEYPIVVREHLRGTLDYLLQGRERLLVIEAKNGDLQRGFVQLVAELAALDEWEDTPAEQSLLYGAVSIGNVWQFAILNRKTKQITQDLSLFRVPDDLHELVPIMAALLVMPHSTTPKGTYDAT